MCDTAASEKRKAKSELRIAIAIEASEAKHVKNPGKYIRNLSVFFIGCILVGMVVLIALFAPASNPHFLNEALFRGHNEKDVRDLSRFASNFGGMGAASCKILDQLATFNEGPAAFTAAGLAQPERVTISVAGGKTLGGWFFKGTGSDTALLCFDGFGKRLALLGGYIKMMQDAGLSVLVFDYRCYGANEPGTPQEAVADGRAAYDFLINSKGVKPDNVLLFGRNLGAYVALRIAQDHDVKGLVLECPWRDVKDAMESVPGAFALRLVPRALYTDDCLNNVNLVKEKHAPILVVSSDFTCDVSDRFSSQISQPVGKLLVSEYMPTELCVNMDESGKDYTAAIQELLAGKMPTSDKLPAIAWQSDYDAALKIAQAEKKNLLIDVRADWCPPCRRMEKSTFVNPQVVSVVQAGYVPLRINNDDKMGDKLAAQYSFNSIPTLIILGPDGKLVRKHSGYMPSRKFLEFLQQQ